VANGNCRLKPKLRQSWLMMIAAPINC
jgi:hypothetical protein